MPVTAPVLVSKPGTSPTGILTAWHLLSLDAPTVAVLWTAFLARTRHVTLPPIELVALFLAVWLLYATDRLLDARSTRADSSTLAPRHLFHRTHATAFRIAIVVVTVALIPFLLFLPRADLLLQASLALLLIAWFALIHLTRLPLYKEALTALFFAVAVAIPTFTRSSSPIYLPAAAFALLATANLLYITIWESPSAPSPRLPIFLCLVLLVPILHATPALLASALAAALLLALHCFRHRLLPTTLRAAADFVLLTPALFWPFLK